MNQLVIKKKNELSKKKKGFTLIELIIVIAIIAVLAAIAIPKFGAVKKDANLVADQANAKIIATAVATAVANGDIDVNQEKATVDKSKYVQYIDGREVPKPKTSGAGGFKVVYESKTGTTVFLNKSADGTGNAVAVGDDKKGQVYPTK